MLVEEQRFQTLFRKIKQIREELAAYAIGGDDPSASIDNLHDMIMRMYNLKISLFEVANATQHFTSLVLRYVDGRAEIILPANLPDAEKRFAVAKELLHLALDQEEDWSIDAHATIEGLIELRELEWNGITDHKPSPVIVCEHLAAMAAIELLYPQHSRDTHESEIVAGNLTFAKLALKFKLQVRAVRLAHAPSYKLIVERFRVM